MWEPEVDWRKDAACNGVSSEDACLQYAISTNQAAGVWGGLDANERRRLRRRLRDRERRKAS
jgi:WhiB family redox-sensing transcriptional regulator